MEATKEDISLLTKIIPPCLEDAGLEDCALSPDSIKEAFFKAASTVKSRATSLFHDEDDDCVGDPWPKAKGVSDLVVGVSPPPETLETCGVVKGGGVLEEGKDKVVVVGNGDSIAEGKDELLVVVGGDSIAEGKGDTGCVEGLKGLSIKEKEKKEERKSERPTLVEGFM